MSEGLSGNHQNIGYELHNYLKGQENRFELSIFGVFANIVTSLRKKDESASHARFPPIEYDINFQ